MIKTKLFRVLGAVALGGALLVLGSTAATQPADSWWGAVAATDARSQDILPAADADSTPLTPADTTWG